MGVIPMVVKNSPLWGPMGITISVGAMVSMVFIVTVIPVGYYLIMRNTIPGLPRYEDSAV
jgi:multidrug efflux pump subunit AcrB